jgi:hypothetical protein
MEMNGQFQRPPNLQQLQQNLHAHQAGIYTIQQQRASASRLQNLQQPAYYPEAQQTRGSGEAAKSAAFFGVIGLLMGGPAGAVVGGVVGGILGKAFGK